MDKIINDNIIQHNAKKETLSLKLRNPKSSVSSNEELRKEMSEMNNKIKDLLVKIENNNLFIKEDILKEVIDKNNSRWIRE